MRTTLKVSQTTNLIQSFLRLKTGVKKVTMTPAELKAWLLNMPFPNDYWIAINAVIYELMDEEFITFMENDWQRLIENDPDYEPEKDINEEE